MKIRSGLKLLAVLLLCAVCVAGCGKRKIVWSPGEAENFNHFVSSIQYVVQAHIIAQTGQADAYKRTQKMRNLYEQALQEANLVQDDVLKKANSDLPDYYRDYFVKGAALRVSGWKDSKAADDTHGQTLMNEWGAWYQKNRTTIKTPTTP